MIRLYDFDEVRPEEILTAIFAPKPTWKPPWMPLLPMSARAAMRR